MVFVRHVSGTSSTALQVSLVHFFSSLVFRYFPFVGLSFRDAFSLSSLLLLSSTLLTTTLAFPAPPPPTSAKKTHSLIPLRSTKLSRRSTGLVEADSTQLDPTWVAESPMVQWTVPIKIGGNEFELLIDTGSSNL